MAPHTFQADQGQAPRVHARTINNGMSRGARRGAWTRTRLPGDLLADLGPAPPRAWADVAEAHTQNRGTLHLHGGFVPWISDGTPHQWTTPAGEIARYPKGVSVRNVPDMPDPGDGSMTNFYNNQQSARLQFYHDHAWGITRLNVYAGEAAGYIIRDGVEDDLIKGTNLSGVNPTNAMLLPADEIPLIIQDRTFVDAATIYAQDPTWRWGSGPKDLATGFTTSAVTGDLWFPHVYVPVQNPCDTSADQPLWPLAIRPVVLAAHAEHVPPIIIPTTIRSNAPGSLPTSRTAPPVDGHGGLHGPAWSTAPFTLPGTGAEDLPLPHT